MRGPGAPAERVDLPRTKKVVVMVDSILALAGRGGRNTHPLRTEGYAPTTVIRRRTSAVVCVFATMSTR